MAAERMLKRPTRRMLHSLTGKPDADGAGDFDNRRGYVVLVLGDGPTGRIPASYCPKRWRWAPGSGIAVSRPICRSHFPQAVPRWYRPRFEPDVLCSGGPGRFDAEAGNSPWSAIHGSGGGLDEGRKTSRSSRRATTIRGVASRKLDKSIGLPSLAPDRKGNPSSLSKCANAP